MITFLFWNIARKPLEASIAKLASLYELDIIILTECTISPATMLIELGKIKNSSYRYAPSIGCRDVDIYTAFPVEFLMPLSETDRLTIRHLTLPGLHEILLAATHFPSKLYWDDPSQGFECVEISQMIRETESLVGHSRTVLCGDFNMNPFEDGVISANGFHAVMTRSIAERKMRTVQNTDYPFFYNPMWGFFGDCRETPPGTYYYERSIHKQFFWNIFDQVLLRPSLLPLFDNRELRILSSDGHTSFLSGRGIPDSHKSSDHLPILFKLEL